MVVGGSYIGLEFAQMYRRFGADVTIVEMGPRLIAREDEDISDAIREILVEARGSRCGPKRSASASAARRRSRGVGRLHAGAPEVVGIARAAGGRTRARTRKTSVSTRPASRRMHAATSPSTSSLATNVPGIWALGDCNGRGAFTHTAYNDFEIVAANLLDGEQRRAERPHSCVRALHRSAARPRRA